MKLRRTTLSIVLAAAMVSVLVGAMGSPSTAAPGSEGPPGRKHPKMDSHLVAVAQAHGERGNQAASDEAEARGLDVENGRIRVVIEAASKDDVPGLRGDVASVGGSVETDYENLVQALVPPGSLQSLAKNGKTNYLRPPLEPETLAVQGQGPAETRAAEWQLDGLTGAGTKVAIVDLGFAGLATAKASGDIPASAISAPDMCSGGFDTATNHGTGVAEIVHEMAPDAQLYLICIGSEVDLGNAKDYAISNGIDVISHSVGWFNSSRGDGTAPAGRPEATMKLAREAGILWVNSAGNYAQNHWMGTFNDPNNNSWHDFAASDEVNSVLVPAGRSLSIRLKWDDWPLSDQDFDLVAIRGSDSFTSDNYQNGTQSPTESLVVPATTTQQLVHIRIMRFDATETPRFDLFALGGGSLEHRQEEGSLNDLAQSPDSFAVGAIYHATDQWETFSSRGPTIDGRTKPDIAAPDGVSSTTYPGGFYGTSASTPHVSGAAALVAEAFPAWGPEPIQRFLETRAADLGTLGKDTYFGWGKLQLLAFNDVPQDHLFFDHIEGVFGRGITNGCSSNPSTGEVLYCPGAVVTRGAMAKFLMLADGQTQLNPLTPTFPDVPTTHTFYGWIERLVEQGITSGFNDGTYRPGNAVTRGQMAKFLMLADGQTQLAPATPTFADVPADHTFYGWIERLNQQGITSGCGTTDPATGKPNFCPSSSVTRGAMAKFLMLTFPTA